MNHEQFSRRGFLKTSAAAAAALSTAAVAPSLWGADATTQPAAAAADAKRSAADQVQLGKSGVMLSRLGIGTGSNNGHEQSSRGKDEFNKLIRYAYDHGITYIDTAEAYTTFPWIAGAIEGIPREKLFIQSKIDGRPEDILGRIDHHRSVFKTDYVDSMLIHCMVRPGWTEQWKRIMDGFDQAKEKKWIRVKGTSCHSLPALRDAVNSDWHEVHLVRVNPMGAFMDGPGGQWNNDPHPVEPVLAEIKSMHEKGRGVIGMKICGNGTFTDAADRDKSIRFAMSNPNIDAVVIGMKSPAEIDENIMMINRALAAV